MPQLDPTHDTHFDVLHSLASRGIARANPRRPILPKNPIPTPSHPSSGWRFGRTYGDHTRLAAPISPTSPPPRDVTGPNRKHGEQSCAEPGMTPVRSISTHRMFRRRAAGSSECRIVVGIWQNDRFIGDRKWAFKISCERPFTLTSLALSDSESRKFKDFLAVAAKNQIFAL